LFKQNDTESLLDSMRESLSLDMEKTSSVISNLNAKYYPSKISNNFFIELLGFFDWR